MKEYLCKKDYYIDDELFALKGDYVHLLPDNTTIVNTNRKQNVLYDHPEILEDIEYFVCTFSTQSNKGTDYYISSNNIDKVDHPAHYTKLKDTCGIEVIDITRNMDFCLGNAIKYILRAGYKSEEGYSKNQKEIEDLEKAIWYIKDKISQLKDD